MLNLVSLSTQSLASCVNYFCLELFTVFFQHENRFRYKFFDIVQFSRSCAPQPTGWQLNYFITEVIFCQALFSKRFEHFELGPLQVSRNKPELLGVYWFFSLASQLGLQKSFFCLSAWRSSIIPYTGVDVNTFLQVFSRKFEFPSFSRISSSIQSRHGASVDTVFRCFPDVIS